MTEKILVEIAWPYASASIHVGNITGSHLPADIYARYHRLKGNDVVMVSGSDSHGTPVTVKADAEGTTPLEVAKKYHEEFVDLFQQLGIHYDQYTSTHTENHFKVAQSFFLALKENGYLYEETQQQWYSEKSDRFLPDRYVEGTCYNCGADGARGDQCDTCGSMLDSTLLKNPISKMDGSTPVLKDTTHFFLDLSKLENEVVSFLESKQEFWRANVVKQSLGWIKAKGLLGRPITRDLTWGVPVPVDGWDGKCMYVWFEAVIGYLSATIEWAKLGDENDKWEDFWLNPDAKASHFIGKDNIPFHAIMWPAQLLGAGEQFCKVFGEGQGALTLPYDVPANEFMNMEDRKISGSKNWGVWGLDYLTRYDPDPLRFYLTINMPEARDSNWDWDDFISRNNNDLVATWGNLANRVLSFTHKKWDGVIPQPGELSDMDKELISTIEKGFDTVGELIETVKLRAALSEAMRLASEVNKYLDETAPWTLAKTDLDAAGTVVYVAIKAIDSLKTIFSPFLPFTSEKLNSFLREDAPLYGEQYTQIVEDNLGQHKVLRYKATGKGEWKPSDLKGGTPFQKPTPLYKKLDKEVAEQERDRLN